MRVLGLVLTRRKLNHDLLRGDGAGHKPVALVRRGLVCDTASTVNIGMSQLNLSLLLRLGCRLLQNLLVVNVSLLSIDDLALDVAEAKSAGLLQLLHLILLHHQHVGLQTIDSVLVRVYHGSIGILHNELLEVLMHHLLLRCSKGHLLLYKVLLLDLLTVSRDELIFHEALSRHEMLLRHLVLLSMEIVDGLLLLLVPGRDTILDVEPSLLLKYAAEIVQVLRAHTLFGVCARVKVEDLRFTRILHRATRLNVFTSYEDMVRIQLLVDEHFSLRLTQQVVHILSVHLRAVLVLCRQRLLGAEAGSGLGEAERRVHNKLLSHHAFNL